METLPTRRAALALFGAVLFAGCTNEGPTQPTINTFTCTPTNLPGGAGPVTLTWAVNGAISLTVEPTVGSVTPVNNGSTTVQVTAATTFTLSATGLNGSSTATCQVSVTQVPVINSFTASPPSYPDGGGFVLLSWSVTGAATLSIDQGVGAVTPATVGSKTVLVSVTTTFTLTAMDSAGNTLATAMVTVFPPTSTTVNGTVVDIEGQPASGQTVLITSGGFSQMTTTDANGAFSVLSVPPSYSATVIQSTQAIQYQGLTRRDPTLGAFFFLTNNRSASLAGSLSGGTYPEPSGYQTQIVFNSPQTTRSLGDPTSGSYSKSIPWPGPSTTVGSLYALQIHNVAGLPADYPGYGTLSNVSLADMGSVSGQNVSLSPVTSGALSGTITPPAGYTVAYKAVSLQVATSVSLSVIFDVTSSTTFNYVTPAVASTSLNVAAAATSAAGEFSGVLKASQSANGTGLSFTIPAAPTLTAPANGSTGVTTSTPFSWTTYPNGIYELEATSATGPKFVILTAATTATIPDLSSYGLPLPASTSYTWVIVGLAPVSTIDLLAAPGGFNAFTVDLDQAQSVSDSFTTGP
jgi:Carboxypeptidase regulatory-like domain